MKWSQLLRVFHWGPVVALSIIGTISTCTIMCDLMWWPLTSVGAWVNIITFLTWNLLTLYNFFNAMYIGPGNVPFEWKPEKKEDRKCLQFCTFCEGYKAPRSHHCRKCQRCVMKMDHHCPWINNCVGHFNHASFCYFLFFAPCGCIHATCILIPAMYRALFRPYDDSDGQLTLVTLGVYPLIGCIYGLALGIGVTLAVGSLLVIQHYYMLYGTGREPVVMLSIQGFILCMFSIGLGLGVVIAVGGLFVMQLRSIIKNETGIESWIKSKAEYRDKEEGEEEFVFPYNLGWKRNLKQVFTLCGPMESDGIVWPVREGCHQYTLTVEQIKQKKEKKIRSVLYDISEGFSGSMCPCNKGCKVYCCPPCTDEPRIKLHTGDKVLVSRWKKHWLYGDKVLDSTTNKDVKRVRGWFPRRCAVEKLPPCQNSTSDSKKED